MNSNAHAILEAPPPDGRRVLTIMVAEDEPMISTTLIGDLEEVGYGVAGPFSRCADAIAWVEGNACDLAMLDVMLRDGLCTELAESLRRKGVPFLIFSGYYRSPDLPPVLRDAPWVEKPGAFTEILVALKALAVL
jgi:DNA-binding response OmpR family regulator